MSLRLLSSAGWSGPVSPRQTAWGQALYASARPADICRAVKENVEYRPNCIVGDEWRTGLVTWQEGVGDCEDMAACVRDLCRAKGLDAEIFVFRDNRTAHAVTIGSWNRWLWMSSNGSYEEVDSIEDAMERIATVFRWDMREVVGYRAVSSETEEYGQSVPVLVALNRGAPKVEEGGDFVVASLESGPSSGALLRRQRLSGAGHPSVRERGEPGPVIPDWPLPSMRSLVAGHRIEGEGGGGRFEVSRAGSVRPGGGEPTTIAASVSSLLGGTFGHRPLPEGGVGAYVAPSGDAGAVWASGPTPYTQDNLLVDSGTVRASGKPYWVRVLENERPLPPQKRGLDVHLPGLQARSREIEIGCGGGEPVAVSLSVHRPEGEESEDLLQSPLRVGTWRILPGRSVRVKGWEPPPEALVTPRNPLPGKPAPGSLPMGRTGTLTASFYPESSVVSEALAEPQRRSAQETPVAVIALSYGGDASDARMAPGLERDTEFEESYASRHPGLAAIRVSADARDVCWRLAVDPDNVELLAKLAESVRDVRGTDARTLCMALACLGNHYMGQPRKAEECRRELMAENPGSPYVKTLSIAQLGETCQACQGRGQARRACPFCHGDGSCATCGGSGVISELCPRCDGEGRTWSRSRVSRAYLGMLLSLLQNLGGR